MGKSLQEEWDAARPDLQSAWDAATPQSAKPFNYEQSIKDMPTGEFIAGLPIVRFGLGVVSPILAGAQMLGGKEQVAELQGMKERGMAKRDPEGQAGFDWMGLLGSLFPSTAAANRVVSALPAATSTIGKIGVGAATGGTVAAMQPVEHPSDNIYGDKALQVGTGAALGGAIPAVTEASKALYAGGKSILEPLTTQGRANILKRYQERLLGDDPSAKAKVIEALQSQRQGPLAFVEGSKPTAGELLANTPEATGLASHQARVSKIEGVSPDFAARSAANEAARRQAIGSVAQTPSALEAAIRQRAEVTTPMREKALAQANMKPTPKAAPADEPGLLKTAAELHGGAKPTPLKSSLDIATEGLERNTTPITAKSLIQRLRGLASQPGTRASDVATKSMQAIEDKLATLAQKDGRIDARDLYMLRKEAGNVVQKFADESKNFDQRMTAGLVKDVQGYIDDAIEAAGGKDWKAYLKTYQSLSKPINEMQVGQELEKALTSSTGVAERGTIFSNAVRDAPKTIKRATGSPRFDTLDEVLTPEQSSTVKAVAEELARKDAFKAMAGKTNFSGAKAIHEGMQFPQMLSRPASIVNYLMGKIGEGADQKIARLAGSQYLNPQMLAEALKDQPPTARQLLIEAIMKRAGIPATVGAADLSARQF